METEPQRSLRLVLVRHGESLNNVIAAREGITREQFEASREADPNLSELGLRQAESLGRFLVGDTPDGTRREEILPIGALYVSPVKRAMRTLSPAARLLGLSPQVWTDCFEVGGIYHVDGTSCRGITRAEMHELFPTYLLPEDVTAEGWYTLSGRETDEQAHRRAEGTAQRLRLLAGSAARPEGTLLLLTHHDQLNLLLKKLLRDEATDFVHANTGISCLDLGADGNASVVFLNCTDHLAHLAEPRL